MIKEKEVYTSPTTEVLVVRFEGALMGASELGDSGFGEQGNVIDTDLTGWGW